MSRKPNASPQTSPKSSSHVSVDASRHMLSPRSSLLSRLEMPSLTTIAQVTAVFLMCKVLWVVQQLENMSTMVRTFLTMAIGLCLLVHVCAALFYGPFRLCQHCLKTNLLVTPSNKDRAGPCCAMRRRLQSVARDPKIVHNLRRLYESVRCAPSGIGNINQGYGIFHHPLFPRVCDAPNCVPPTVSDIQKEEYKPSRQQEQAQEAGDIDATFYMDEAAIEDEYDQLIIKNRDDTVMDRMMQYAITCNALDDLYRQHVSPPRTRHCHDCQQCRAAYSHHCAFVQSCIYEETYPPYITYLLTSFVSMAITAVALSWDLAHHTIFYQPTFPLTTIKLVATLVALGLTAFLATILGPHLICLYDNIEFGTRAKYAHILGEREHGNTHPSAIPSPWDFKPKYGRLLGLYLNLRYRIWDGIGPMSCWVPHVKSARDVTIMLSSPPSTRTSVASSSSLSARWCEVFDTLASFSVPLYFAHRRRKARATITPGSAAKHGLTSTQEALVLTHAKGLHFPDLQHWLESTSGFWIDAFVASNQIGQPPDMRASHRLTKTTITQD